MLVVLTSLSLLLLRSAAEPGSCAARVKVDAVFVLHHPANVARKARLPAATATAGSTLQPYLAAPMLWRGRGTD